MAGKRKTKNLKGPKKLDLKALKASDVLCPICRTILIEPVTLPCNHAFCNACFKDTMENAILACPLCRTRVGSWYRTAKKSNSLVDEAFWSAIKESFPQEVQNKYDGLDSGIEEDRPVIVVADPGEIRKEYEKERKKDEQERKKVQDLEEKASAALIKKIEEEEEYRKLVEEEKLKLDAELARKLGDELLPSTSKQKRTPKKSVGPMDKFLQTSSNIGSPKKAASYGKKLYSSGVLCLDKFPKNKNNGTTSLVMPVVQKKIQQIHRILETEERKNTKPAESSTSISTQLDSRFHFKPIEVYKRSPVDRKMSAKIPVKVPYRRVTVDVNVPILSPIGRKPKLDNRYSAFSRFSISEGSRPLISQIEEKKQTSQKSTKDTSAASSLKKIIAYNKLHKNVEVMESEHEISSKRSNNNYFCSPQRNIARRIFQKKNSTIGSGDESPFLGFDKTKNSKSLASEANELQSSVTISLDNSLPEDFLGWPQETRSSGERTITKLNKLNNTSLSSNSTNPIDNIDPSFDDSITEDFLGWFQKTPKISAKKKIIKKSSKSKKHKISSFHSDITTITLSSDGSEKLNFDESITEPLIGFESCVKNLPESENIDALNCSITEPFNGFDNSEKSSCAILNGLNNGELSPEISTSQIRQKKQLRIPKRNGIINNAVNGLSPVKRGKIKIAQTADNKKKRKLQEHTDFELAKKLQAQFDDFSTPKRTRRGTERQVTLDEMFAI